MLKNLLIDIKLLFQGSILSYPQVFFSKSKLFAWFIILVTFIFPSVGFSGLICASSSLFFALILRFNRLLIQNGYYAYNALLVGLAIGSQYTFSNSLLVILIFSGFLTLLIHVTLETIFTKYNLPILSFPFLLSTWIILLATRQSDLLTLSDHNIFILNNIFYWGGNELLVFYEWFNNQWLSEPFKYFFISLGSIFFQDNALAGFVIFIGLLFFSRIASTLVVIGFFSAYYFMQIIGIGNDSMSILFIGFNFMLTAIAIGSTLLIPNIYSYMWVIVLTPVNVIITLSLAYWFNTWQLSIYSLPFNIIVILFLLSLKNRYYLNKKLIETPIQEYMPEKNLYSYIDYQQKTTANPLKFQLLLPFWGKWTVWQGYNGTYTHKDLYRHAIDFVITYNNKTYKNNGALLEDYYTYNKLVLSPGNGWIVKIIDGIDDNPIGDVNTLHNWGNSIIIKHDDFLYTQMSHLKNGSFRVREGEYVKAGQPIALVGNSGRSPEPHLHFQVQTYPNLGAPGIEYQFSRYVLHNGREEILKLFSIPNENDIVENISIQKSLSKAFHFIPGEQIDVIFDDGEKTKTFQWNVYTDSLNRTYIHNNITNSLAYTYKNDLMFYFTSYHGRKDDPLYLFYCSCYYIEFAYLSKHQYEHEYPLHQIFPFYKTFVHDAIAPFYRFMKALYRININIPSLQATTFTFNSETIEMLFKKTLKHYKANIYIEEQKIKKIEWTDKKIRKEITFIYKNKY